MRHKKLSSWLKHTGVLLLSSIIDICLAPVLMLNIAVALFNLKSIRKISLNQFKNTKKWNIFCVTEISDFCENNKAISIQLFIALAIALMLIPSVFAIPNNLNLIGRLTTPTGSPMTGNYNFSFRIYDNSTAGNLLFELNTNLTTNSVGVYDVILQNLNLNFSDQYYLGIAVYNDEEMTPRINLTTAPYAFRANVSEALNELNTYKIASLNVTGTAGNITFDSKTLFVDVTNNRVGIGTTTPAQMLDVRGHAQIGDGGETVALFFNTNTKSDFYVGGINVMTLNLSGNVGIGTTSPQNKLEVVGTINASKLISHGEIVGNNLSIAGSTRNSSIDGSTLFIDHTNDRVGIGTTSPSERLEVIGNISVPGTLFVDNTSGKVGIGTTTPASELVIVGNLNVTGTSYLGDTIIQADNITVSDIVAKDENISFFNATKDEKMRITYDGKVGIGTTSPGEKLHVIGNVNVTGNITAGTAIDITNGSLWQPVYGTDDDLILYLPFSEATGTTAYDRSPYGNDGTITGTTTWTTGKYGNALSFTDGYVDTNIITSPGAKSVTYWVKYDTVSTGDYQLQGIQEIGKYFYNGIENGGQGYFYTGNAGGTYNYTFSADNWYFVVMTMDGSGTGAGNTRHYVNGKLVDTKAYTADDTPTLDFYIGKLHGSVVQYPFDATIDEFKIYKRTLSADEIRTHYLSGTKAHSTITANQFRVINTSTDTLFFINKDGNVGIGTTSPGTDVAGSTGDISGRVLHIKETTARAGLAIEGNLGARLDLIDLGGGADDKWMRLDVDAGIMEFHSVTDNAGSFKVDDIMALDLGTGNVGIGTTSPNAKLVVVGGVNVTGGANITGNLKVIGDLNVTGTSYLGDTVINADNITVSDIVAKKENISFFNASKDEKMRITYDGKVGIGTSKPQYKLEVLDTSTSGKTLNVSNVLYVNASSGNIGIDTTSPLSKLDVSQGTTTSTNINQNNTPDYDGGFAWNATLLNVTSTSGFPTAGTLVIDNESITYSGVSGNTFTGLTRGALGTSVANHTNNTAVYFLTITVSKNTSLTPQMIIRSDGNVGIGTTSPRSLLHVNAGPGDDTGGGFIRVSGGNSANLILDNVGTASQQWIIGTHDCCGLANGLYFQDKDADTGVSPYGIRMFIDGSGNVGIGTTSPATTLDVDGGDFTVNATSGNVGIGTTTPTDKLHISNGALRISGNRSDGLSLNVNDVLYINGSSGNVGIGTTEPLADLQIGSNTASQTVVQALSLGAGGWAAPGDEVSTTPQQGEKILLFADGNTKVSEGFDGYDWWWKTVSGAGGDRGFAWYTENTAGTLGARMRIDEDGNVGIGTTGPNALLDVHGDVIFNLTTSAKDLNVVNGSGSSRFFIDNSNGNVGIGTTSPNAKLVVNGGINITGGLNVSDGNVLLATSSGNVGIGTINPSHKLNVVGDLNVTGTSYLGDTVIQADNITVSDIVAKKENISFFNATKDEKMRITYDGKVGIGITSPEAKLHIVKVNTSGAKAMQLNVSADSDSDTVYGIYSTVDPGTGTLPDSGGILLRLAEGIHNEISVPVNRSPNDWDWAEARGISNIINAPGTQGYVHGVYNEFEDISGGDYGLATGVYNYAYTNGNVGAYEYLYGVGNYLAPQTISDTAIVRGVSNQIYLQAIDSGTAYGYGVYNDLIATWADSGTGNATVYGVITDIRSEDGDIGYAYYASNGNTLSTGGTQYGLYINYQDTDVTNYQIYEATNLGSNILYANTTIGSTSNPDNTLSVTGNADFTGNVGIGTTTPNAKLVVVGGVNVTGGANITGNLKVIGDLNVTGTSYLGDTVIQADNITVSDIVAKDENISFFNATKDEKVRITYDGKVGIGTTTPTAELTVDGSVNVTGGLNVTSNAYFGGNVGIGTTGPNESLQVSGAIVSTSPATTSFGSSSTLDWFSTGMRLISRGTDASTKGTFTLKLETSDTSSEIKAIHVDSSGNIGIGTTSPSERLEVIGNISVLGTLFVDNTSQKVGIGTTTPTQALHVVGNINATGNITSGSSTVFIDGTNSRLGIGTITPSSSLNVVGDLNVTGTSYLGDTVIQADNITVSDIVAKKENISFFNASKSEKMRITYDGKVGIATTTPEQELHVAGRVVADEKITDGLILSLHFDENGGNITADDSGYGNNGTCYNMSGLCSWTNSSKFDGAIDFNEDGYISVSYDDSFNWGTNDFAVEFWMKPEDLGGAGEQEAMFGNSGDTNGFVITHDQQKPYVYIDAAGGLCDDGYTLSNGVWYHFVATRSGDDLKCYIDGEQYGTTDDVTGRSVDDTAGISIGDTLTNSNFPRFNGTIDEVKVYKRALSSDEIAAHYAEGRTKFGGTEDFIVNNTLYVDVSTDRVGIGNAAPSTALEVGSGTFTVNTSSGNVGIGTATSPHAGIGQSKLAIEGADSSNSAGPVIQFTTATNNYPLLQVLPYTHDNIQLIFDAYFDGTIKSSDAGSNFMIQKAADLLTFNYDSGIAAGSTLIWNNAMTINTFGNVGIGTTSPSERLEVIGNISVPGTLFVDNTSGKVGIGTTTPTAELTVIGEINGSGLNISGGAYIGGNIGIGTTNPNAKLVVVGGANITGGVNISGDLRVIGDLNVTGTSYLGDTIIQADNITVSDIIAKKENISFFNATKDEKMRITYDGKVGIGTTTPTAELTVDGSVNVTGGLNVTSNAYFGGNVGIGTTSPSGLLHTSKSASDGAHLFDAFSTTYSEKAYILLRKSNSTTLGTLSETGDGDWLGLIGFRGVDNTDASDYGAYIKAVQDGGAGSVVPAEIQFWTSTDSATAQKMVIDKDGKVGIGTTTPSDKLTVSGNTTITGNTLLATSSGNVGIGTTEPLADLQIGSNTASQTVVQALSLGAGGWAAPGDEVSATPQQGEKLLFFADGNTKVSAGFDGLDMWWKTVSGSDGDRGFAWYTENTASALGARMRIDENGNIGIGTTIPTTALHVNSSSSGSVGITVQNSGSGNPQIRFLNSTGSERAGITFDNQQTQGKGLLFSSNAVDNAMVITSDNKVGIGTINPSYPLHVSGNTSDISIYAEANISAGGYIDHTPFPNKNYDALREIKLIKTDEKGNLDHSTLPEFAKARIKKPKYETVLTEQTEQKEVCEEIKIKDKLNKTHLNKTCSMKDYFYNTTKTELIGYEEVGARNLGNMVSINTRAIQQIIKILETGNYTLPEEEVVPLPLLPNETITNATLINQTLVNETIPTNITQPVNVTQPLPQPQNQTFINNTAILELQNKIIELESRITQLESNLEKINGSVIIKLG